MFTYTPYLRIIYVTWHDILIKPNQNFVTSILISNRKCCSDQLLQLLPWFRWLSFAKQLYCQRRMVRFWWNSTMSLFAPIVKSSSMNNFSPHSPNLPTQVTLYLTIFHLNKQEPLPVNYNIKPTPEILCWLPTLIERKWYRGMN